METSEKDGESCPNCGTYCSNNTVFCNPPIPPPIRQIKEGHDEAERCANCEVVAAQHRTIDKICKSCEKDIATKCMEMDALFNIVKEGDDGLSTFFKMFTQMTELRLIDKQRAGWVGWDKLSTKALKIRLFHNIENGDWIDVANISMFLWARRWRDENAAFTLPNRNT